MLVVDTSHCRLTYAEDIPWSEEEEKGNLPKAFVRALCDFCPHPTQRLWANLTHSENFGIQHLDLVQP